MMQWCSCASILTESKYPPNKFFYFRHAHGALHQAHKGHESMHAQMLMILLITVLVAQVVLVEWRKRHFRSYQVFSCLKSRLQDPTC